MEYCILVKMVIIKIVVRQPFRLPSRKKQDTTMSVEYDLKFESQMNVWEKATKITPKC